ncbi:MAG: hypothetical protein AAGJ29_12045, partial [Pseudomonadota bacterium]
MLKPHLAVLGAIFCCSYAFANTPAPPSRKPPVVYASTIVSTQDAAILRDVIRAVDARDWARLRRLQETARDETVADFALWHLALAGNPYAGFDAQNQAMTRLSDWPRAGAIRAGAEEAITVSTLSYAERILWFDALGGPRTGEGKAALADAYFLTGQRDVAAELARSAWREHSINPTTERNIFDRFAGVLTQDDHRARMNYLL